MATIKSTIVFSSVAVFGVVLALFAFVVYERMYDVELSRLDARLESHADKISTEMEEDSGESDTLDTEKLPEIRTGGLPVILLRVIGEDGRAFYSDTTMAELAPDVWREVIRNGAARRQTVVHAQRAYRCLWIRSEPDARLKFIVQVAAPMDEIAARQRDLILVFLIVIPLAVGVSALAAFFIIRKAFRPIARMIESAKSITATNLHRRVEVPATRDEVHDLGETLNTMIGRIDDAFRSQQQFIADASHEIRTPLTVLCSELEFIEQHIDDPALRESLQASLQETDRLTRLADGLLLLARADADRLKLLIQPVRLDELIVECVQRMGNIASRKEIALDLHIGEAVEIHADGERLRSVFLNLIDNAIKYSPAKSIVSVRLSKDGDRLARATISDRGAGIPADALPHIFKRFYRADAARSGSAGYGLGLAIVDRLVALHRGKVSVESVVGEGSTFTVELPVDPAPPAPGS